MVEGYTIYSDDISVAPGRNSTSSPLLHPQVLADEGIAVRPAEFTRGNEPVVTVDSASTIRMTWYELSRAVRWVNTIPLGNRKAALLGVTLHLHPVRSAQLTLQRVAWRTLRAARFDHSTLRARCSRHQSWLKTGLTGGAGIAQSRPVLRPGMLESSMHQTT